jgi:hypothetical protein
VRVPFSFASLFVCVFFSAAKLLFLSSAAKLRRNAEGRERDTRYTVGADGGDSRDKNGVSILVIVGSRAMSGVLSVLSFLSRSCSPHAAKNAGRLDRPTDEKILALGESSLTNFFSWGVRLSSEGATASSCRLKHHAVAFSSSPPSSSSLTNIPSARKTPRAGRTQPTTPTATPTQEERRGR